MFEDATPGNRHLLQALAAEPKPPYAPCGHCGSQNRYERSYVCRRGGSLYYGCCRATLSCTPDVDIKTIEKCSERLW